MANQSTLPAPCRQAATQTRPPAPLVAPVAAATAAVAAAGAGFAAACVSAQHEAPLLVLSVLIAALVGVGLLSTG